MSMIVNGETVNGTVGTTFARVYFYHGDGVASAGAWHWNDTTQKIETNTVDDMFQPTVTVDATPM